MRSMVRFGDGASLREAMDGFFGPAFPRATWQNYANRYWGPAFPLDIYEDGDTYYVYASPPGVSPQSVEITAFENTLTIAGETKPVNPEGTRALIQENGYGKFSRQITLPMAPNADEVVATFENDLLKLTVPKAPQHRQRKIAIQGATAK